MNTTNERELNNIPKYHTITEFLDAVETGTMENDPAILAPGTETLTYAGLKEHILWVKSFLHGQGISKHDRVAVVIPNGPEMATAFPAVMAGAVCAPLNPKYQAQEYEFYLSDLEAKALILPADFGSPARDTAKSLDIPIFHLYSPKDLAAGRFYLERESGGVVREAVDPKPETPGDTALILHTSGTTSRPKMVPLSRENLFTSAYNVAVSLGLTPQDRCLNVMPLFHIHGLIAALLASLNAGGSVVCTPGFEPGSFFPWVDEFRPTWYTAVPTIHQSVLSAAKAVIKEKGTPVASGLRLIRSCSSSLPPQVMKEMEELFHVPVVEAYGMTEAAHQISCNPIRPGAQKPGSVGVPAGPEIAIMDKDTPTLLRRGETGEIVIKGPNVTAGYKNNPEANKAAFSSGWFRTGDEGRFDDDGYLYLTGRLKEQINQGGQKITPREIDEVLMDHEAVHQAVAFAMPHPRLGEAVAAVVVFNPGQTASEAQLKAFASRRLADYKVPRQIVFTDKIPKGATGKLQRIGLHEKLAPLLKPGHVPPESETEYRLASVWSELLGYQSVGRFDNFFTMGGDSILAAQAVARINNLMDTDISIPRFFLYPTPADLAYQIDESGSGEGSDEFSQLLSEIEGLSEEDTQRLLGD